LTSTAALRRGEQVVRVPDLLGDSAVKIAALGYRLGLEFRVWLEGQAAALDEGDEARVFLVAQRIETRRQEVLTKVVRKLLLVRIVVVARIELSRQEKEVADPVAVPREVGVVGEVIAVALRVVGPYVFDLVADLARVDEFGVDRRAT
jgi:hypothetical protein